MSALTGFSAQTVMIILERDGYRCAWCGDPVHGERGIAWSVHHRAPRSMGGTRRSWVNQAANGVLVHGHGSAGCHGEIERERDMARNMGFLVSSIGNEPSSHVPIRHAVHGLCLLDDDGAVHGQEVVF